MNSAKLHALFDEHFTVTRAFLDREGDTVLKIGEAMVKALKNGGKVLWCGNGGSAADCQHLAAELIARFKTERRSLPSIALTTDTSILTAIGNDYSFERIFSRQVEGLANPGDIVVGMSTSGNSKNVIEAMKVAKEKGAMTIGFLGNEGGKLKELCDLALTVPAKETARIQEVHIICGHVICELIDEAF